MIILTFKINKLISHLLCDLTCFKTSFYSVINEVVRRMSVNIKLALVSSSF